MLEKYGLNIEYIVIALAASLLILLIITICLIISQRSLKKKYKNFMSSSNAQNLEEKFLEDFKNLEAVKQENKVVKIALKKLNEEQKKSYSKTSLVKYDAFDETTGKLSFVIALLNDGNNGVILNSVYSTRSGCFLYAKEIINGESYKVLTEEEKIALKEAIKSDKLDELN